MSRGDTVKPQSCPDAGGVNPAGSGQKECSFGVLCTVNDEKMYMDNQTQSQTDAVPCVWSESF